MTIPDEIDQETLRSVDQAVGLLVSGGVDQARAVAALIWCAFERNATAGKTFGMSPFCCDHQFVHYVLEMSHTRAHPLLSGNDHQH